MLSCKKKLDLKPDSGIVIPSTAKDLENILDNAPILNVTPVLPHVSADEYFIPTLADWQALFQPTSRNAYIWNKEIYDGETNIPDWNTPYSAIFYCNNVLDILNSQNISNDEEKKKIKGWALFSRAYAFYSLVSTFSKAYNNITANSDLGLPLKLTAGIDTHVPRSSVEQTYNQIISDALTAAELLQQDIIPGKRNRPSKIAAFALLARVYLSMRKYDDAEFYANKTLSLHSRLTDFNSLSKTVNFPFTFDTEEVIYYSQQILTYFELTVSAVRTSYAVSPELIRLYDSSDLRLHFYFQKNDLGNYNLKPINSPSVQTFTGIATDEIYLVKAECLARRGDIIKSMDYLNQLVSKRWNPNSSGSFKPYQNITASNPEIALNEVLKERRRALVWRSIRWTDIKRLNLEKRSIHLTRKLGDKNYTLEANSDRYALPIPNDEITLSGIEQNHR